MLLFLFQVNSLTGFIRMQQSFYTEIEEALDKGLIETRLLSQQQLANLPPLLQRYMQVAGFLDRPVAQNMYLEWQDTYLKLKPDKDWMPISCKQFNAVHPPMRVAFMAGKMLGLAPLTGQDMYKNGMGNMLIKLAGFTLSDAKGPEMNASALVTFLSEAILLPGAILSGYIDWQQVSDDKLEASIKDAGISVKGEFRFNADGLPVAFETSDRYYSAGGSAYEQYPWTAYYLKYKDTDGYTLPSELKAAWQLPQGEYTYFKGLIKRVIYNVEHLEDLEV